ncbi:MAG: ATP-binding cassette domain-containing protein [Anaerolineae bacterium]|nr:ATP-binding cassette domain-containing protein [Anaerolineae bacterium]
MAKKKNKNGNNAGGLENGHLIDLRDVHKVYKTDAGDFPALKDIDLKINAGEFAAVIGKSGSGKSTLINMITGIDRPSQGEVFIDGTPIHLFNEGQMARWRGRNMGIVFQFFQLLPTLSVVENVMLPMDFCRMFTPRERYERAMHLLELVDVAEHAHKLPTAVSGGQQQRVAIARAMANDPPIIVADEPTGNLDSRTSEAVYALFEELVEQGKTILMVTHDDDMAQRVSRTIILADGEIVNEYLVRAMPSLTPEQLVSASNKIECQTFAPGEPIILQDAEPDKFYIVTKGEVDIFLSHHDGHETYVDTMGVGQYFGEMALLSDSNRTATVRASRTSEVEVAVLDKAVFNELMSQSEVTHEEIRREAARRSESQERARNGDR